MRILGNKIFLLAVVFVAFVMVGGCRQPSSEDKVEKIFDEHSTGDLVFFYTKTSTYEQRTEFYENVLNENQSNRGYWPRPGVKATWGVDNHGYEGFAINFDSTATSVERQAVKEVLQASPLVFRVYENQVPGDINDLP